MQEADNLFLHRVKLSVGETVRKCSLTKYNQTRYFEATVEHVCQNDHTKKKLVLIRRMGTPS